jgi:hypothetical protein
LLSISGRRERADDHGRTNGECQRIAHGQRKLGPRRIAQSVAVCKHNPKSVAELFPEHDLYARSGDPKPGNADAGTRDNLSGRPDDVPIGAH